MALPQLTDEQRKQAHREEQAQRQQERAKHGAGRRRLTGLPAWQAPVQAQRRSPPLAAR